MPTSASRRSRRASTKGAGQAADAGRLRGAQPAKHAARRTRRYPSAARHARNLPRASRCANNQAGRPSSSRPRPPGCLFSSSPSARPCPTGAYPTGACPTGAPLANAPYARGQSATVERSTSTPGSRTASMRSSPDIWAKKRSKVLRPRSCKSKRTVDRVL